MTCYLNTHYLSFNFQMKREKMFCMFYLSKMKDCVSVSLFFNLETFILDAPHWNETLVASRK